MFLVLSWYLSYQIDTTINLKKSIKILFIYTNVYFRADELRQKFDLEMAAYKQTAHHY